VVDRRATASETDHHGGRSNAVGGQRVCEDNETCDEDELTMVAIKTIKGNDGENKFLNAGRDENLEQVERETQLLTGLCHENIVQFYGIAMSSTSSNDTSSTSRTFDRASMMLFEYMVNGDLKNFLRLTV